MEDEGVPRANAAPIGTYAFDFGKIGVNASGTESASPLGPRWTYRDDKLCNARSLSSVVTALLPTDEVQRAEVLSAVAASAVGVDGTWLSANLTAGTPLEPHLRSDMEDRFGTDLSAVRIHTDPRANLVARTLNARALTVGQHIAFAEGQFKPESDAGRKLIMHELAHTIQQQGVQGLPQSTIPITRPDHMAEREADATAEALAKRSGRESSPQVSAATSPQLSLTSFCEAMVEGVCWASFSAIAAVIALGCTSATVVSFGGLAIPCTGVIVAGAALAAFDAVMCTHLLQNAICGTSLVASAVGETGAAAESVGGTPAESAAA